MKVLEPVSGVTDDGMTANSRDVKPRAALSEQAETL